jgi:hypothetical protein
MTVSYAKLHGDDDDLSPCDLIEALKLGKCICYEAHWRFWILEVFVVVILQPAHPPPPRVVMSLHCNLEWLESLRLSSQSFLQLGLSTRPKFNGTSNYILLRFPTKSNFWNWSALGCATPRYGNVGANTAVSFRTCVRNTHVPDIYSEQDFQQANRRSAEQWSQETLHSEVKLLNEK